MPQSFQRVGFTGLQIKKRLDLPLVGSPKVVLNVVIYGSLSMRASDSFGSILTILPWRSSKSFAVVSTCIYTVFHPSLAARKYAPRALKLNIGRLIHSMRPREDVYAVFEASV
jgi:hypothetical protein